MIVRFIYSIVILITIVSCSNDSACSMPKGEVITENRDLSSFTGFEVLENMNVTWMKSSDYKVEIITGENFIDQIETSVSDNMLTIENQNTCSWLRDDLDQVEIKIHSPSPTHIIMRGSGTLSSTDTMAENLRIENFVNQASINLIIVNDSTKCFLESGSLDLTISGSTHHWFLYNVGYNHVYARNFITENCHINNNSWTPNEITVTNSFLIENYTFGEIRYWGNPLSVTYSETNYEGVVTKMD